MVHIWIHHGTHSYVDMTCEHSTVYSAAGVCLVCVTLQVCVCLIKESSVTESYYGSTREHNAGSNAKESDVIWYVLALILLQGYKGFVKFVTMHRCCSSMS